MRLRFSLRLMIAAIVVLAAASYWAFVRPTVVAHEFANAVQAKDYTYAESFCRKPHEKFLTDWMGDIEDYEVDVKLGSREWHHLIRLQHPMFVRLIPKPSSNPKVVRVGINVDAVATPYSVKPSAPRHITYKH